MTNRKRDLAVEWLSFRIPFLAAFLPAWDDQALFKAMQKQGFFWHEERQSWFKQFEIDQGESHDKELWMQGLPDGRFQWNLERGGKRWEGIETTLEAAIEAATRALAEASRE